MKITIKSLTEKGFNGLQKYFPNTTWFKVKCKMSQTEIIRNITDNEITITIHKKFANDNKDKTFVVYIIQDLRKEQEIQVLIDYNIEAKFNE
jgi:hypothetical protein